MVRLIKSSVRRWGSDLVSQVSVWFVKWRWLGRGGCWYLHRSSYGRGHCRGGSEVAGGGVVAAAWWVESDKNGGGGDGGRCS